MFVKYLKHTIYFLILAMLAVTYSCGPLAPESLIVSRIDDFEAELNQSGRSTLYQHFHPDIENYQQIKDPSFFDSGTLSYSNAGFAFSMDPPVKGAGELWTSSGTLDHQYASNLAVSMTFKESDMDYYIYVLDIDNGAYQIKQFQD